MRKRAGVLGAVASAIVLSGTLAFGSTAGAGPVPPSVPLGQVKVAVILVNFDDAAYEPYTARFAKREVFGGGRSADSYYREVTHNRIQLVGAEKPAGDVYGWYRLPATRTSTRCIPDFFKWMADAQSLAAADGFVASDYDYVILGFPFANCPFGGFNFGAQAYLNGYIDWRLVAHEFGHALGMQHAGTWRCQDEAGFPVPISDDCTQSEYADPFDVMGHGVSHVGAWHRLQIGGLPVENVKTVTETGTYELRDHQRKYQPGKATQLLQIPRTRNADGTVNDYYTVELNARRGKFQRNDEIDKAGVVIRIAPQLIRTINGGSETQLILHEPVAGGAASDPVLRPGRSFTDPYSGVTIQLLSSVKNGRAIVDVTVSPTPGDA